ncbi:hypothetical protein cgp_2583 [Corynebacterium glutamicum MB001]|nr:hypothetical protein cgp_2583 [Corynebacterium glutamicum MB001]ASW14721.1 hypothetical protein cgc1_2583 [Corynebacterium glutamicum]QYO74323.1 hypothetical protein cgisf_2583 [Corynebacterium glutamicum]
MPKVGESPCFVENWEGLTLRNLSAASVRTLKKGEEPHELF